MRHDGICFSFSCCWLGLSKHADAIGYDVGATLGSVRSRRRRWVFVVLVG